MIAKKITPTAKIPLLLLTIILSSITVFAQQELFVSPTGDDNNDGTLNKPLRSLEAALAKPGKNNAITTATIFLLGGNYEISETIVIDSILTNGKKITITAYDNQNVLISGGKKLDQNKFILSTDKRIQAGNSPNKVVYETNLAEQGVNEYGIMKQHGFGRIENAAMEVFINKQPLTLARWPNSSFVPIGKIIEPGSNTRAGDKRNLGAKFEYNFTQPSRWNSADNIWLYGVFANSYADDNIAVESINASEKTIKLKQAGYYGVSSTYDTKKQGKSFDYRRFYFYNVAEELDSIGEWYLDRDKKKLFLYPTAEMKSSEVVVSVMESPLLYLYYASNIVFKNIGFGYGRGIGVYASGSENIRFENCDFFNFGVQALCIGEPVVSFKIMSNNRLISKDRIENKNFSLSGCTIYNTGAGALTIAGGDRKTLSAAGNSLTECEIYNYSRTNRASPAAIQISGVGNSISNCYIHDGPSAAIGYKGNDHKISFNHIKNVAFEFSDIGAVYTGRDPSSTGTQINNNFFDSIQGKNKAAIAAVYIDDCSSGITVSDNIFYKCGSGSTGFGAIHINGGYENRFENNFFIACDKAFTNTVWPDANWVAYMQKPDMQKKLKQDVDVESAIYSSRYPFLKTLLNPSLIAQQKNYVNNSFQFKVAQFVPGKNRLVISNSFVSKDGSELADVRRKNFTLKSSMERTTGLKKIGFNEIGMRKKQN